ncbi:MAG: hypothetical protein MRY63_08960 [Neomegalonema sp.]|nr:hypothetical protein [Neomegalonema sp.]
MSAASKWKSVLYPGALVIAAMAAAPVSAEEAGKALDLTIPPQSLEAPTVTLSQEREPREVLPFGDVLNQNGGLGDNGEGDFQPLNVVAGQRFHSDPGIIGGLLGNAKREILGTDR